MAIKTILSDVGGVLIKNYEITSDVQWRVGLDDERFLPLWDQVRYDYGSGKIDEPTMWQTFADNGGNLVDVSENLFGTPFAANLRTYPEVDALMRNLRDQGYQIAILSDTNANHQKVLQERGVYEPFGDNVFLSHEIGHRKPSAGAYQHALRQLGINDPSTVLFIDDRLANVEAAQQLGIQGLHVEDNEASIVNAIRQALSAESSAI